jgi:hypothetical protein
VLRHHFWPLGRVSCLGSLGLCTVSNRLIYTNPNSNGTTTTDYKGSRDKKVQNLLEIVSSSLRFVRPQLVSLIIHPQFRLHILRSCLYSRLRLQGLPFLARSIRIARINNQRSGGIVTAMVQCSVHSLLHQRRDLHHSTYLYLSEDQDSTSLQVVLDFRLPVKYYLVLFN